MRVGLLHPGEMGAAVATALRVVGHTVLWASADRSEATVRRAKSAGLEDCVSTRELAQQCDVIFCLCPPAVAVEVARQVSRFAGIYVDANAISPATSRSIERSVPRYVDGAIIGPPPTERGSTRIYLSGREADTVGALFAATIIEPLVVSDAPGSASALKMAYSAWTKGTAALVLTIRSLALAEGIEQPLLHEWTKSLPDLRERSRIRGTFRSALRVALGCGDERDRRHFRGRRSARRFPPRRGRDLSTFPTSANGERRPRKRSLGYPTAAATRQRFGLSFGRDRAMRDLGQSGIRSPSTRPATSTGVAETRTKAIRHGARPRFTKPWIVPRWMSRSPARRWTVSPSSSSMSISPSITTA